MLSRSPERAAPRAGRGRTFRRLVEYLFVFGLLGALAAPSLASASSITGYQPPQNANTAACPPTALLPGTRGANGSLVAFFQPGPEQGYTCGLPDGGELVGTELIIALWAPQFGGNGTIPIAVQEFSWGSETLTTREGNQTVSHQIPIEQNVVWSNTSIQNSPGSPLQFGLLVPEPGAQTNLSVDILGTDLQCGIVAPGAGISIPTNYPQLLTHDFGWVIWVAFFFIVGIGVATALRLRARHVERLAYFGGAGLLVAFAFGAWFLADYPLSAVPVGSAPEAVVASPVILVGIYFWLALFPTDTYIHQVRYPIADVKQGKPQYGTKRFRVYFAADHMEYIGPGGATQLQRILGHRTILDDRVLTNNPRVLLNHDFESKKHDVYAEYMSPGELPNGPKVLEVVRPRIWWFPWRAKARAEIETYHSQALKEKVPAPQKVGTFVYVSPSRAFLGASGGPAAAMVQGWITGTLHLTKIAVAFERLHLAYLTLRASFQSEVYAMAHKVAYTLQLARRAPQSPMAKVAIELLETDEQAFLYDQTEWAKAVRAKVEEEERRRAPTGIPAVLEASVEEIREKKPLDGRSKGKGQAPGASGGPSPSG